MKTSRKTEGAPATVGGSSERAFERVNHARLERVYASLRPAQRDVIALLPLLFHSNHAGLPGHVSPNSPCGIRGYSIAERTMAALKRQAGAVQLPHRALPRHHLYGLYLIGSVGTIGQSRNSDFDVWLCHDEQLKPEDVAELVAKAEAVEAFAAEHDLEMHFFVFSPTAYREGSTLDLSAESSGSSQHTLLLDEFYRSGLKLAGVNPLWWAVPVDREQDYDAVRADLEAANRYGDYADFGALAGVPVNEFFGAALWQLSKSIDSPYKSVLKLLLMESYAAGFPHTPLLSQRFKAQVEAGSNDLGALDPYILMYEAAEAYLAESGDADRLAVLRRAFYIKAGEPLSRPNPAPEAAWRRDLLGERVRSWGWSARELKRLDERGYWPIEAVMEERQALAACFRKSYHVLTEVARRHADARITRDDLTILGRKLYAAFERKAGKIERLSRGIVENSHEETLLVQEVQTRAPGAGGWALCRPAGPNVTSTVLREASQLSELVAWACLNRVASRYTHWAFAPGSGSPFLKDTLKVLAEAIGTELPGHKAYRPGVEDFRDQPVVVSTLAIVNAGSDPMLGHHASGKVVASSQSDAFVYSGLGRNLVTRIDLLVTTSWGEVFLHAFTGDDAVISAAAFLSRWRFNPAQRGRLTVRADGGAYASTCARRVDSYLRSALDFLGRRRKQEARIFVTQVGTRPHAVLRRDGAAEAFVLKSLGSLEEKALALADGPLQVAFEGRQFDRDPLATVLGHQRGGYWQLFAIERGDAMDIAVLDEFGRLFARRNVQNPEAPVIGHFWRFLNALAERRQRAGNLVDRDGPTLEAMRLYEAPPHGWQAELVELEVPSPGSYLDVKVIGTMSGARLAEVIIVCGEREYSSSSHGSDVYRVAARDIVERRRSHGRYPVYVTDMDIRSGPTEVPADHEFSLVRLLGYKNVVEQRLNEAMNAMDDGDA